PGLDERDRRRRQAGGAGDARRRQPGAPGQHAPGGPAADRGGTALMSELTLTIIKLGFLAVLWLFVLSTVSVIRTDLFGAKVPGSQPASRASTVRPPKPRSPLGRRGTPTVVVIVQGAGAGRHFPLGAAPLTIGRGSDCDIVADDEYVSTHH